MSMTNSEHLNTIFKKYGLVFDNDNKKDSDIFKTRNFTIITRSGIEKVQAGLGINAKYEVVHVDPFSVAVKGVFTDESGHSVETFGEASIDRNEVFTETTTIEKDGVKKTVTAPILVSVAGGNVKQEPAYLFAMAEKRALSRGVLKTSGLYELGVFGEDESEDFRKELREARNK
jgi:hypothetical protein